MNDIFFLPPGHRVSDLDLALGTTSGTRNLI